jgi:hypothetical protein
VQNEPFAEVFGQSDAYQKKNDQPLKGWLVPVEESIEMSRGDLLCWSRLN